MSVAADDARVVEAPFESRQHLAEALILDTEEVGLFVAGDHDLHAGERIRVLVRLAGVEPGLLMTATVLWRRVSRGARAPAGLGVAFAPDESARFAFLRTVAVSGGQARERAAARHPVSVPIAFVLSRSTSVRSGALLDVSAGGAQVHATPAPEPGQVVVLRLRDGRSGPPVPTRVAWSQGDRAGLALLDDRPEVRRFWDRVVQAARAEIEAHLVRSGT